jgi:DSF synthase
MAPKVAKLQFAEHRNLDRVVEPGGFRHARVSFDYDAGVATLRMHASPRPCYTPELLEDIARFEHMVSDRVQGAVQAGLNPDIRYIVLASDVPGVYNLGGDLDHFTGLIRQRDRHYLTTYAHACIDVAHRWSVALDLPITPIALIQGRALGGGFEAALASHIIIAERGSVCGFPERVFSLFPGMGAITFLCQRVAPGVAERMIRSGTLYSAEELYDMGVVDVLCDPGEGEKALRETIRKYDKQVGMRDFIQLIRQNHNRASFEEMKSVTEQWVESALKLTENDLKVMERLVRSQNHITEAAPVPA